MSDTLALSLLAIGLVVGYIAFLYYAALTIARILAARIGSRRGQTIVDEDTGIEYDEDDEIVGHDIMQTSSGPKMRAYSREDSRVRFWFQAVFFPLLLYLHYKFWSPIAAGFEQVFKTLGEVLIAVFYGK